MAGQILYNSIKSSWDRTAVLMERGELVSLPKLKGSPEAHMNAQIVHVKKGSRISMFKVGDRSKKVAKSYDRLVFLRDLESGQGFVVISETRQESVVLFHKGAKMGDYVRLLFPDYSHSLVADLHVVDYSDVLMPLVTPPPNNRMVSSVSVGGKFSIFAVKLMAGDVKLYGMGVEDACSGTLCDGVVCAPCPCLAGTGVEKCALTFKLKVPVDGLEGKISRFRSIRFTKSFFGPSVMRKLSLYPIETLEQCVSNGMKNVESIVMAGWAGYSMDEEDDIGIATKTHVTSFELIFKKDGNGASLEKPLDDLPLPDIYARNDNDAQDDSS